MSDSSNRKRCRSRPFLISDFGSQTRKESWRRSSPCTSRPSSRPGSDITTRWGVLFSHSVRNAKIKSIKIKINTFKRSLGWKFNRKRVWVCEMHTFQHANMHGIVGSLRDAQHHIQAFFYLSFPFLTARQQLLHTHTHTHLLRYAKMMQTPSKIDYIH